ncbi:MAG: PIG-L deacetylase family protein [bacterium]|nr:PIG-L deacetylase family protein [bacterium]
MIVSEFIAGLAALALAGAMASTAGRRLLVRRYRNGARIREYLIIVLGGLGLAATTFSVIHPHPHIDAAVVPAALVLVLTLAIFTLLNTRIAPPQATSPKRVLAIGAHPDDLELACGATLARLVDTGHEVHAIVLSHGAQGGDASTRPAEAQRAADFLGLASITVHDLPDTNFELVPNELVRLIEAAIAETNPQVIFTHSQHDQHQDHHAVHLATLRAARQHHSILCFESPSTTREFNPDVFIDVEDYTEVKVASVLTHRNQAGKPYMTPEVVRGITAFRGRQAKRTHAEGFEAVRLLVTESGVL